MHLYTCIDHQHCLHYVRLYLCYQTTGDDNMRKIIGESMLKSQRGEKPDPVTPSTFSKQDFNADNFDDFGDM
jgi:hypothetical protein